MMFRSTLLEPTHEMYLNNVRLCKKLVVIKLEPTHEMYLNC